MYECKSFVDSVRHLLCLYCVNTISSPFFHHQQWQYLKYLLAAIFKQMSSYIKGPFAMLVNTIVCSLWRYKRAKAGVCHHSDVVTSGLPSDTFWTISVHPRCRGGSNKPIWDSRQISTSRHGPLTCHEGVASGRDTGQTFFHLFSWANQVGFVPKLNQSSSALVHQGKTCGDQACGHH